MKTPENLGLCTPDLFAVKEELKDVSGRSSERYFTACLQRLCVSTAGRCEDCLQTRVSNGDVNIAGHSLILWKSLKFLCFKIRLIWS